VTRISVITSFVVLSLIVASTASAKAGKEVTFDHHDVPRSYVLFEPETHDDVPPLLLLLHGSGRRGDSLIKPWKKLAEAEGVVLVAPNSADPMEWSPYEDSPSFFRAVLDHVEGSIPFDRSRVYVFGHSSGAVWGLQLGLLASEEIAAVAVHAGLVLEPGYPVIDQATRKVPISIQVGDRDRFFPVDAVQSTVDYLNQKGFSPQLAVIRYHDHDYYRKAKQVNNAAWTFFSEHALTDNSSE
jgi:poly(3-hydroxybutyrate) depolymerase